MRALGSDPKLPMNLAKMMNFLPRLSPAEKASCVISKRIDRQPMAATRRGALPLAPAGGVAGKRPHSGTREE